MTKLYPHNQTAYDNIQKIWKESNRCAVVQPTGSGKSYVIMRVLEDFEGQQKLVLAPSTYILEQLKEKMEDYTDTEFITYQKLAMMSQDEIDALCPAVIVLDEFHRCGADQWGQGVQRLIDAFPSAFLLGATATPIRFLDNCRDMADELFNGYLAANISLVDALVDGILPMPRYISALYTFSEELDKLRGKVDQSANSEESKQNLYLKLEHIRKELDKSHGMPTVFKKYLSTYQGKFVVFCRNKTHLKTMKKTVVQWFKEAGAENIHSYCVYDGYAQSDKEFEAFKNADSDSLHLLFCVDMLNEGIHVNVDGVILLRPTVSGNVFYQQIGRCLDSKSEKTPLIFDLVNSYSSVMANTFKSDLQKAIKKKQGHGNGGLGIDIDIPDFIILDELRDSISLFKEIESQLVDNWEVMFEKLKVYSLEHGNCDVCQGFEDTRLINWVKMQRRRYLVTMEKIPQDKSTYPLSEKQIALLNRINFDFNYKDNIWIKNLQSLKEFRILHPDINIPSSDIKKYDLKLFRWCFAQKHKFMSNSLEDYKINLLKQEGFNFEKTCSNTYWDKAYIKLLNYYNDHGTVCESTYKTDDGFCLGVWLSQQRTKCINNELAELQIKKLNDLGYNASYYDNDLRWQKQYDDIKNLVSNHSDFDFSKSAFIKFDKSHGQKLYDWLRFQKKYYKTQNLNQEKTNLLRQIKAI